MDMKKQEYKSEDVEITYYQEAQPDRQESVWYNGEIAKLTVGDRKMIVLAAGEVRIMGKDGYVFLDEIGIETDEGLENIGHDYEDEYYWVNNNWFEFLYAIGDSYYTSDMGDVCFEYDEAIGGALDMMVDDRFWADAEKRLSKTGKQRGETC